MGHLVEGRRDGVRGGVAHPLPGGGAFITATATGVVVPHSK